MLHIHRWPKWGAPVKATLVQFPNVYRGEYYTGPASRETETTMQERTCETCGQYERRVVSP